MKRVFYLTDAMIPGMLAMHNWERKQSEVADIVVSNDLATQFDIAEMDVRLNRLTIVDTQGNESNIREFSTGVPVRIKGISGAGLLLTRESLAVAPGEYEYFRMYIEPQKGHFIHTDRTKSEVGEIQFLEFKTESILKVKNNSPVELILRFDFPPFKAFDPSSWGQQFLQDLDNWRKAISRRLSETNS